VVVVRKEMNSHRSAKQTRRHPLRVLAG